MSLGTSGLGGAGLALEGVGLGGAGLEAGAAAAPAADPDITDYSLTVAEGSCTLVVNNHLTPVISLSGDRVYWARGSGFTSFQYELTTPGDLSSLTGNFEAQQEWHFGSGVFRGIALTPDQTKAYKVRRSSGSDDLLSSADPFSAVALGDPATNPYDLLNTAAMGATFATPVNPGAIVAAPNNLDLYVAAKDTADRAVYHFQMSVAGDASTVTALGQVLDLSSRFATFIYGIYYTPDGSKLFVLGDDGGTLEVAQYDLDPAYDVTTAVDSGKAITVNPAHFAQVSSNLSITVWENPAGGFKLYLTYHDADNFNNTAMEFDVYEAPSGDAPNISDFSASSYSGDISASSVDPNGVFVDASGTRAFVVNGSPGNDLNSYSMSVPFDLTTLSAVIASEAISGAPIGVFFKPDGTKVFVTSFTSQIGVLEFPLSVAWDITTMGSSTLLSTAGDGATIPFGLHFSSDGLNVYTSDNGGNLYQWSLASAWDVSSPTFIGSFDFTNEVAATKGQDLSLSVDGTRLYLPDLNVAVDSEVFQYTLDTPFDVTTAVYHGIMLTLTGRIGMSGFHMLDANDRFYAAYNGDAGGADPEALEEFTI